MTTLKQILLRKKNVAFTQKVTSAMRAVSWARLSKLQKNLNQSSFQRLRALAYHLVRVAHNRKTLPEIFDRGILKTFNVLRPGLRRHLIIALGSERGLCGVFNHNIAHRTRQVVQSLREKDCSCHIFCVGTKIYDLLRRNLPDSLSPQCIDLVSPTEPEELGHLILEEFVDDQLSSCSLIYTKFKNFFTQDISEFSVLPLDVDLNETDIRQQDLVEGAYIYEPSSSKLLEDMIPFLISSFLQETFHHSKLSEEAFRVKAMDAAMKNAEEVTHKLNITYHRLRQAKITKELIEIISGAESL